MDPERLIDEGSEFEAGLLRAARQDAMPEQSGQAICAALGVAHPPVVPPVLESATVLSAKVVSVKAIVAVAALGAAAGMSIWASSRDSADPTPKPPLPALHVAARPPASGQAMTEASPPIASARNHVEERLSPPARRDSASITPKVDTLPLELQAIDTARSAFARGDHALALRHLDQYAARFPKPRLGAEAAVLRIETHAARGESAAALRLGRAFLSRQPNSPYARRVRSLIGDSAGAPPTP